MLKYYYIDDVSKLQCGPFNPDELLRRNIHPETMMWCPGMHDWTEAGALPELAFLFDPGISSQKGQEQVQRQKNASTLCPDKDKETNSDQIPPKTWMIEAIIFTFVCCSPVSLIGLYFASRVETLYYTKKSYVKALKASNRAKNWSLGGILFWPVIYVIYSLVKFGILAFL